MEIITNPTLKPIVSKRGLRLFIRTYFSYDIVTIQSQTRSKQIIMENKRPIEDAASRKKESSEIVEDEERDKQEIQVSFGKVFFQILRVQNLLRGPVISSTSGESSKQ